MTTKRVGCFLALALAISAGAGERQDLLKALHDAEVRLEESRRTVPSTFDLASETRAVQAIAGRAGVKAEVKTVTGGESVAGLEIRRLDVAGSGTPEQIRDFLWLLAARDSRAGNVESLRAEGGRFRARLAMPVYAGVPHSTSVAERLANLRAMQSAIDRMNWSRVRDAVALLDAAIGNHAVRVTAVRIDGDATIEGALVGVAARKELVSKIEAGGLAVARLRLARTGACRSFAITARRGAGESQTLFDLEPSPLCRADVEPPAAAIAAKGAAADGLDLHLRDVDLADLFFVLYDLTGESFIVDANVKGAVDVDVEQATIEQVLDAIRSTNVVISAGPLHRVSRPNAKATPKQDYSGEPVSIALSDAALRGILCLYESITPLKYIVPRDLASRANVFVRERPWDEVLDALLAAAPLRYAIEKDRVLVGEKATTDACKTTAAVAEVFSETRPKLTELGAADLTLAGVSRAKAYVYGPWRRLLVLEPGTRVFDGVVRSITPNGVRFSMDGGLVLDLPLR